MNIRKENIVLDKHFPFNITRSKMPPGSDMGKAFHWHECLEISYVKSGRGRYYIEDKIYEMEPGDIIILNNIEPHFLEVYSEEMEQPVVIFDPTLIWSDCSSSMDYDYLKPFLERGTDFSNKLDLTNPITAEIKLHLEELEKEYFNKPEGYQLMIKARLLMILTYLIRYFRDTDKLAVHSSKRQHLVRINEVLKYISKNFMQDIKLDDAASMLCVSPQYFSTFFKKVTGTTFIEYINNLRINHAIKLLKETDNKITRIAIECGFNNTTNFNNVFKKFTGKTPSELR